MISDILLTATEKINDVIVITDHKGNIEYVNKQFTKVTGYKQEEVLGENPRILKSGKQKLQFYQDLWKTILSGEVWKGELINKTKSGSVFLGNTTIYPIFEKDEIINFLAVKSIITEEKKIIQSLEKSYSNFKNVFDFAKDSIVIHDFSGKMLDVNKSFYERLGYTYEEAMKLVPEDFDINETKEKFTFRLRELIEKGYSVFETKSISKNNIKVVTEVSSRIIEFNGEKAILSIGRDITQKQKLDAELKKAKEKAEESANMKSAFLANMSHEIRTPMNGIIGFTDLLKNPDLPKEKRIDFIDIISKSGNHLLNLINDIIDISKIDAGHVNMIEEECKINFCLMDLFKFFEGMVEEKSHGKVELIINYGIPVGEDSIITDETRIRQIITNLIGNAIKFTDEGKIIINSSINKDNEVFISVEDSGIGMSKDEMSVIFERFRQADDSTTRKYGGTGLGLAISKAYVDMLGGKIWVESKKGKGSTFYFTIPYKRAKLL